MGSQIAVFDEEGNGRIFFGSEHCSCFIVQEIDKSRNMEADRYVDGEWV